MWRYAIGKLTLTCCKLEEDTSFISSLLEAPHAQLCAQDFPVDRITPPEPKVIPVAKPPALAVPMAPPATPPAALTASSMFVPTMVQIPPLPRQAMAVVTKSGSWMPPDPAGQNSAVSTEDSKMNQKVPFEEEQKVSPPSVPMR